MKAAILSSLAGVAIGVAATLGYNQFMGDGKQLEETRTVLAGETSAKAAAQSQLTDSTRQLEKVRSENTALKNEVMKLTEVASAPSVTPAPAAPSNGMAEMMKAGMKIHIDQKLLAMKSRLKLTPEQEASIRAILEADAERSQAMTAKIFQGGKMDPEEFAKMGKDRVPAEKQIEALLTADQQAEHKKMETEETQANGEMMANMELNKVAPMLGLSEQQKDQFYNAIYKHQSDRSNPEARKKIGTSSNPDDYLIAEMDAKKAAVAGILTPAQMEIYSKQLASEQEMAKSFMSKMRK